MPLINVRTSLPEVVDSASLLKELSAALAQQTGKPESYVMTLLETAVPMTFAGSADPCAYVEIKSIGALKPAAMTSAFCKLIEARTGIGAAREGHGHRRLEQRHHIRLRLAGLLG